MCAVVWFDAWKYKPTSPDSFLRNLATAGFRSLLEVFFGGVIFNLGNLLLVAAMSVAGMAVAFPIGAAAQFGASGPSLTSSLPTCR
jgi:hypothetical protein